MKVVSSLKSHKKRDLNSKLVRRRGRIYIINKKLVHLVLIQFKEETTVKDFQLITDSAYSLQAIPGVEDLNFGKNVSPEGLGKGFSHSLTMRFSKSVDRDSIYLPHPIHKKFVELFVPFTNSVLVYDFWE